MATRMEIYADGKCSVGQLVGHLGCDEYVLQKVLKGPTWCREWAMGQQMGLVMGLLVEWMVL